MPDFAIKAAVGWLRDYVRQEHTDVEDLPAIAYAHYVLARAKVRRSAALRYFSDTQLARLPTQLAKAQLAAALALYGDTARAAAAYDAALEPAAAAACRRCAMSITAAICATAPAVLAFAAANPGNAAAADRGRWTASPSSSPAPAAPARRSRPGC